MPSSLENSAHVGISVLPTKSNSYNSSKSIISEYLLAAYLNTNIEHPSHYFKNDSLKYLYELDNLLLVEAKNKFEWRDVFNSAPKKKYEFKKGFNITGELFNKELNPKSKILFYQNSISNAFFTEIKSDNTFNIKNIYITKGDSLSFTINDEQGHNMLPVLNIEINPKIGKIHLFNLPKNNYKVVQHNIVKPDSQKNINRLDEVTVIGKRKINYDHQMPSTGVFEAKKISTQDIKKYRFLSNFIKKLGFKVMRYAPTGSIIISAKIIFNYPPNIIVDGFKTSNFIHDYPLEDISEISYEDFGLTGSNGGTIYINLKNGADKISLVKKTKQILVDNGFEKTIKEYSPKKLARDKKFQPDCIYWNGNLKTNKQGEIKIDFQNFGIKEYKIYIEGFTENGDLISQELNLNPK